MSHVQSGGLQVACFTYRAGRFLCIGYPLCLASRQLEAVAVELIMSEEAALDDGAP
jgi:hypothetical protein